MLKLVQVQARLSVSRGLAQVKQMSPQEPTDLKRGGEVIALFQQACRDKLTRAALDTRLLEYSGTRLDYREIDGLAKVICDTYAVFATRVRAQKSEESKVESEGESNEETETESIETEEDEQPDPTLTAFRLAVWRQAADPEFYPFARTNLITALKPGLKSLRRAAANHDEDMLAGLLPYEKRLEILQKAAQVSSYPLPNIIPPTEIGNLLFADVPARQRLLEISSDLTVENLLNRYNVELLRGVLYLAPRVKIVVRDKYKDLFKYIKFFGLMHEIKPIPYPGQPAKADLSENEIGGYEILLEGASSPFLARTDRHYGVQFARLLPALLLCEAEWELEAELVFDWTTPGQQNALYKLGPQPHLRTHFKGSGEFDSKLEESLAAAFEKRFNTTSRKPTEGQPKAKAKKSDARKGWTITREDRLVAVFDTVMIPDFAFEHVDGRRAMLEVVGFWERRYLERKIAKLNRAGRSDIIVLVSERTRCGRENFLVKGQEPPYQLIFFKGTPRLGPILEALERCAVPKSKI